MKAQLTVTKGERRQVAMDKLAIAVEQSADRKLTIDPKHRSISATHVTQGSCPPTCEWMDASVFMMITGETVDLPTGGCYGNQGHEGMTARRLNAAFTGQSPEEIAQAEYDACLPLSGKYPLRLGIIGEAKTLAAVKIRASIADVHYGKHGQGTWTYGHALVTMRIPRSAYGRVQAWASCESDEDVAIATELGYAAAVVRPFDQLNPGDRINGMKILRCPQQTGQKLDCHDCGVCLHADDMCGKCVLVFDAHGGQKDKMAEFIARARAAAAARIADDRRN